MKRYYIIPTFTIIGFLLLLQTGCQEEAQVTKESPITADESNKSGPQVTLEKTELDFGEVGFSVKSTGEFKFTNTGDAPLKITKVQRCCGVVAKLDKMEFAPGESGVIKVEWESKAQPYLFMRQMAILSNDPVNPDIKLTIKAKIVAKVAWEPERLKLLLDEENAGCPKLTIKSLDGQQFAITGLKSTGNCITCDYDPNQQATQFDLELKVDTEKLAQNLKGRIYIRLNHPEGKMATILFDVMPKFSVSPPLIIVFNAEPQKPILREVKVLNNYQEDFDIESSSSKNDTIKILNQEKITYGYKLELEITPPPPAEDQLKFSDVFSVNIKDDRSLAVTCNGYYSKTKPKIKTK